jgi:hypothetical protein
MATSREYAYFLKGSKISIVERDVTAAFDNDLSSRDYGPDVQYSSWKSPKAAVTDGLELEYAYSPVYHINDLDDTATASGYRESSGYLRIDGSAFPSSSTTHILIRGSEKWNGVHKITGYDTTGEGGAFLLLNTKYNGGTITESFTVYKDIDTLNDENDTLNIPDYLAKAVVYYVKAKIAEDTMQIDQKEYFLKQFRGMVERFNKSRQWGQSRIMTDWSAAII